MVGTFVNTKTINYIIKYITKIDADHKGYKSIILNSAGIGKEYINRQDFFCSISSNTLSTLDVYLCCVLNLGMNELTFISVTSHIV